MCLAERARPRAQQAPPAPTRWISNDTPLALDAAAPEDGRARALERQRAWEGESPSVAELPATN